MIIKNATFIKSITDLKDEPPKKPQFLMMGRSNVGKSSFINAFTNRKSLARISKVPGKTITLNYYLINEEFYFVDSPGYGYAKRSKQMQADFIKMIENFVLNQNMLKAVLLLIDFKVGPTDLDLETYNFILSLGLRVIVIATKYDKIPKTKRYRQELIIKNKFKNLHQIFFVSNISKDNLNKIQTEIKEILSNE